MKLRREDIYQIALICAGLVVTLLFSVFLYREIYPEYKIYQEDYIALEEFRSTYSGEPVPPFSIGVKQIVLEREDKGPAVVDRCISCHVALEIPAFSPTRVMQDEKGHIVYDKDGYPALEANDSFIWNKLDQVITTLRDEKVNDNLRQQGEETQVKQRLAKADKYESLKTAHVGEHVYDVKKVLSMHPLIGKETRPFEFHPIIEYGCTSCHNGNGNGLVTDKAHGPVFDGQYEVEFVGRVPQFLESDPANDPRFSKVFNGKPGHELLFQTTPIYVGALIQAKCVQCHQSLQDQVAMGTPSGLDPLIQKSVDTLTHNYQHGRKLFIEQACYACHKIAALSRGGVGPELTNEGNSYPWYIKQKIVWPQSDLKTSTMPNMHLDHEEVEDLMTFMLAQKGSNKAVGNIPYRATVKAWEDGRQLPWEKAITPAQTYDLRYSMDVFAAQGCAACHRLKGFESNVGYAIEKGKVPFERMSQEREWFQNLFPEMIVGSHIVEALDAHGKEIDEKIVNDVRQNAILEEIEMNHPGLLESFYDSFKYAARAKNNAGLSDHELHQWRSRVRRVMMMFIQEYGLGRLICPRPNWSGVYRTDEWLMEHFRNPASLVPRSIMPTFPFDDTKFYALTYLLDILGVRNRDADRAVWDHHGFNPSRAFAMYCSQCHGDSRQGNGPLAEWLYPIPKNLSSAEFLRNLTKENAIMSIHHGIKGTPMPPWGDVGQDKPLAVQTLSHDNPIFTEAEIKQLVDWLFSLLPEGEVLKDSNVMKWEYTPEDAVKELKKEGNATKLKSEPKKESWHKKDDVADLNPNPLFPMAAAGDLQVGDLFDEVTNKVPDEPSTFYYIKKKYYTEHNIKEGQKFFLTNCAACHGAEGDGSGLRAGTMSEAKPQMLTNLNWIRTRDDLRLLRSIKYGIPGTAMTPWGDFTTSLLRTQLVIFIRTLTQEQDQRAKLRTALYETFATAWQTIDAGRLTQSRLIQKQQQQFDKALANYQQATALAEKGAAPLVDAVKAYELYLSEGVNLHREQVVDQKLIDLKTSIEKEKEIYQKMGVNLINAGLGDETLDLLLQMIALNKNRFTLEKDKLIFHEPPETNKKLESLAKQIIEILNKKIEQLEKDRLSVKEKEELKEIDGEINTYTVLKGQIEQNTKEAIEVRTKK